jgi:aminoacyl-tRNA hydrolase
MKRKEGKKMKVVIGLGNPGKKYEKTRHNIGFIAVDNLRKKMNISDEREKFQALVSEKNIDGEKVIFLKPQTFMNLSGNSVIEIVNFYKLDPKKDIIVIYDDMDLSFGDIRIREKGSSGGHNGIKSIISHIGEEFIRIKCGIGAKEKDAIEHVLGEFNQTEQKDLDEILEKINNCVIEMLSVQNLDRIMQKYNKKKENSK